MAHIALIPPPLAGHLLPGGALARELVLRGHRVTVLSQKRAEPIARALDLPLVELPDAPVVPRHGLRAALARAAGLATTLRFRRQLREEADVLLRHGPEALNTIRPDALIIDQDVVAGSTLAEHLRLPFVTLASALLWNQDNRLPPHYTGWQPTDGAWSRIRNQAGYAGWQFYEGLALNRINVSRREWQLPPLARFDSIHSGLAELAQSSAEFDFPQRTANSSLHYVGSLSSSRPQANDTFPWDRLDGRPLIFASMGTLPGTQLARVYRVIAEACAELPVQLVLALGKWNDRRTDPRPKEGDLPGNPIVVDFAPQLALLERAQMMITHAGLNTALEALVRGVPMVALPRTADQPGVAARLAFHGAGVVTPFNGVKAPKLRSLVAEVLANESYRTQARRLGDSLRAAGGAQHAADIVERVFGWKL